MTSQLKGLNNLICIDKYMKLNHNVHNSKKKLPKSCLIYNGDHKLQNFCRKINKLVYSIYTTLHVPVVCIHSVVSIEDTSTTCINTTEISKNVNTTSFQIIIYWQLLFYFCADFGNLQVFIQCHPVYIY